MSINGSKTHLDHDSANNFIVAGRLDDTVVTSNTDVHFIHSSETVAGQGHFCTSRGASLAW